jgi:hypothetical protein
VKSIIRVTLCASIVVAVCAGVAFGGGFSSGSAQASAAQTSQYGPLSAHVNTEVSQAQLQACIEEEATTHANCESKVPGLAKCMEAGEQCNREALESRRATMSAAQAPKEGQAVIPQSQAVADALKVGEGLGASISADTKTNSEQLTMQSADALLGQSSDPVISAGRPVWVVTVAAEVSNQMTPPGVTPAKHQEFTVVLDGYSGAVIEFGLGVNALNVSAN